eukprot:TRINITY_DN17151_c0_g1_i1.p1 TRINITY_DN17151_c0_g1~~TRINITY_DN17151_c0_g1_i1.p1  ORF type:complete len:235 (+),score=32.77 TRINITY_DN17151_c0_g1_i1:40-744(+)
MSVRTWQHANVDAPWNPWKNGEGPSGRRQSSAVAQQPTRRMMYEQQEHERERFSDEEEEKSAVPDDVLKYGDICMLHALRQTDTLPVVALMYGTTSAVIRDVNNLKQVDLDCLADGSFLVIPLRDEPELIKQCYSLNQKPDFLEQYGSRLPPSFRQIRKAPSSAPPPSRAATATNWDEYNEPHSTNEVPRSFSPTLRSTTRSSNGSSIGAAVSRGLRSIFFNKGNANKKGKYRN